MTSVHLSGEGRFAMSASADGTLRLWETETGRCLRTFKGHRERIDALAWSDDGRLALSAGSDRTLKMWEVGKEWDDVAPLVLAAPASYESTVSQHRALENALTQGRAALAHNEWEAAVRILGAARRADPVGYHPEAMTLWTQLYPYCARIGLHAAWEVRTCVGHRGGVAAVALSADGRVGLSGSNDWTIRLWDTEAGHCLRTFEGHRSYVDAVALSAGGRLILPGSRDQTLKVWETATGRCLSTLLGHKGEVTAVAFSSDSRLALSGSRDQTVKLWGVIEGHCLRTLKPYAGEVLSVALSPDDCLALSGCADGTLKLWEVATGCRLRAFSGHTDAVTSVTFSSDGRFVLSGSRDRTLRLWDIDGGYALRCFEGHASCVNFVALSADGRFAVSGSADETLKLWNVADGRCLRSLEGHGDGVNAVALCGDGRFALSGSGDHTLKVWLLNWDLEGRQPCDWAEEARPHLKTFLARRTPYAAPLPGDPDATDEALTRSLTRHGSPSWSAEDFRRLLRVLGWAGYGWLRPEGVSRELNQMASAES